MLRSSFSSTIMWAALAIASMHGGMALAQDAPPKNGQAIELEVGFAAGGPTDILARLIGNEASRALHQPVVVVNRTGASGNLATMAAARAKPDGSTLLVASLTHNVNPLLMPETSKYDPINDFTPVSQAVTLFQALVVPYDSPINSVADLIAKAKTPAGVTYGSAGIGGSGHLAAALLANRTGLQMLHVPFRGNAPALTEVVAGRVDFMFYPMVGLQPMVESKRIKVLAVTSPQRYPGYLDVPTMAEAGFPGFERYSNFVGFLAPRGTPVAVVKRLSDGFRAAMNQPAVQEQLNTLGAVAVASSPQEFAEFLVEDRKRWAALIKNANIQAQ